ncbi:hypothetical protein BC835DRAFT_1306389 [Cytidiella melzeri]|nr:hypothetical protein BC835DRAFT_1306389 [Cytidiella melzeri]
MSPVVGGNILERCVPGPGCSADMEGGSGVGTTPDGRFIPERGWFTPHSIVGPDFLATVITASNDSLDNVQNLSKYRTFRLLEFDLVNEHCETLGGIAYINNNHYTFIVICPSDTYVGYGDSMHTDMLKDLRRAVLWWITRLIDQGLQCNKNVPVDQWLCRLPITSQAPYDSFSCRMLAVNALTHHYIPDVELVNRLATR